MTIARYAAVVLIVALTSVGAARADKKDEGKGKPKDAAPTIIQLDVSKLPPDLAKALLKFAESQGKPAVPEKKPAAPEKKPEVAKGNITLPPGLAKKSKDHPGRVHYVEHVLKMRGPGAPNKGAPTVPPAKKGKIDLDDDQQ